MSQTKTTTVTLSDTSPELARFGNLQVLAKLISRQFSPAAVKITVKDNGTKLEFTGTEENASSVRMWLGDKANEFSCRPYVISHPLMAYLLKQPSHADLVAHVGRKCDCLIVPASDCIEFGPAEKSVSQSEVKLANGHVVKISTIEGDITSQKVDVILKPIFRPTDFSEFRNSLFPDAGVAQKDATFLAEPGLLFCKRVLYALYEDTASSAISPRKVGNRFFQKCFEALRFLRVKTLAIPADALCSANIFNGDVSDIQWTVADTLARLDPVGLDFKEIRLVITADCNQSDALTSSASKKLYIPRLITVPVAEKSLHSPLYGLFPSQPSDQPFLNLGNDVKAGLIRCNISIVNADVLVCFTSEGSKDFANGDASCKAIFAAGGPLFGKAMKVKYPDGLPVGVHCQAVSRNYGCLKCAVVVYVALPACPREDVTAVEVIKASASACFGAVRGFHSIAFPVTGLDGLRYSACVVEKGLLAAAAEWALSGKADRLTDIRFVLDTTDEWQALQDDLPKHCSHFSSVKSNAAELTPTIAAFKIGSIKVKLDQMKADFSKRQLLLASSQNDAQFASEWLEALTDALIGADSYHVKSAVIPLQKGAFTAITPVYLADLFFAACVKFEATSPKHLRTLRPYLENSAAGEAFVARITDLAKMLELRNETESLQFLRINQLTSVYDAIRRFWSSKATVRQLKDLEEILITLGLNKANNPCFNVDLTAFSSMQSPGDFIIYGNAEGITKSIRVLDDILKPLTKEFDQDDCFDRISEGFTQTLTPSEVDFCIASRPGTTTAATFMALIGDALTELMLLELCDHPPPLPKDVDWYVRTPDETWQIFDKAEAAALEYLSKVSKQPKCEPRFAAFDFGRSRITIGNSTMTMSRKTDQIPIHWVSSEEDYGHQLVTLSTESGEFRDIHAILQRSNTMGRQVIKIQRIENGPLFKQYLIQKDKITRNCPTGHVVERDLFHGTRQEHVDGICAEGFDRSRAGQSVAAAYGAGSYFSTDFDYSSDRNFAREGHVLYCKVLVGESVQGKQGLSVLPYKPGFPGIKYESAVNKLQNPSIFVIFADCNAYPAYLITVA